MDWVVIWVDLVVVWCGCGGGLGADFGLGVDVVWMFLVYGKKNEEKKIILPKLLIQLGLGR